MDWAAIEANQEQICAAVALQIEQPVTPVVRDTVRDTIHAMREGKIKEFGGLEARCVEAIQEFDLLADAPAPVKIEPEPVKAPKTKKG